METTVQSTNKRWAGLWRPAKAKLLLFQRTQRPKAQLFIAHSDAGCERNMGYIVPCGKSDIIEFTSLRDSAWLDPAVPEPAAPRAFVRATPPGAEERRVHASAAEYRAADFPAGFPAAARSADRA